MLEKKLSTFLLFSTMPTLLLCILFDHASKNMFTVFAMFGRELFNKLRYWLLKNVQFVNLLWFINRFYKIFIYFCLLACWLNKFFRLISWLLSFEI